MADFFSSQMDFIFYIYGLSFIILSAASFFLFKSQDKVLAWKWLALFGLFHGLYEWLRLCELSILDPSVYRSIFLTVLILSFLFLFELGRSLAEKHYRYLFGRGIFIPLISLLFLGWYQDGVNGVNVFSRYVLGLPGGVCASIFLFCQQTEDQKSKSKNRWLVFLSFCLAFYALTQIVVPEASLFPASIINEKTFLKYFHFPVPVLRSVISLSIAISIWFYFESREASFFLSDQKAKKYPAVFIFSAVLIIGWVVTGMLGNLFKNEIKNDFLTIGRCAAAAINYRRVMNLTGTKTDIQTPDYKRLQEQLTLIRRANSNLKFIYLTGLNKNKDVIFLLDTEPETSPDYAYPGESYDDYPPPLKQCLLTGEDAIVGPYKDRWGNWISCFVSIKALTTGKTLAVLGMDTDIKKWYQHVFEHRLVGILLSMGIALFLMVFFIVSQLRKMAFEERRQMEEALRLKTEELDQFFNITLDLLCIADLNAHFRRLNPAWEKTLGYTSEELMSGRFLDLVHPDDVENTLKALSQLASQKEVVLFVNRYRCKDGSYRYIEWCSAPVGDLIYAAARDITERKLAEKKIQETMEMKSNFISMASHELRTPLTAIKSSIDIVSEDAAGSMNDTQKEFIDVAKRNIDRLTRLINNILDFQKLEANKVEFHMKEQDINAPLKEVYETMNALAAKKGLSFSIRLLEDPPLLNFDRDKIIQVITNLVNNALKFTDKGGIAIDTLKKGNVLIIRISDTGIGIKQEDISKLFGKFQQLGSTNERRTGGTGLGLAISRQIMQQHKGRIEVESEPGKGSRFSVILPTVERSG
jgi:PAS domain S-box-containing protein